MTKKVEVEIIVIGMQHSCSRFILNKLTKHPNIIYKCHFSIPILLGFLNINTIISFSEKLSKFNFLSWVLNILYF